MHQTKEILKATTSTQYVQTGTNHTNISLSSSANVFVCWSNEHLDAHRLMVQ